LTFDFNLVDLRQTPEYANYLVKNGWLVETLDQQFVYLKKLPILPLTVLKVLRNTKIINQESIQKLRQKYHVIFQTIEPFQIQKPKAGRIYFVRNKQPNPPVLQTKTLWLDLNQSEQALIANLQPKTRYNLKQSLRSDLNVRIIHGDKIGQIELMEFYKLWSQNKPYNWLFKPSFPELQSLIHSFGPKCFMVMVNGQNQKLGSVIAVCLILNSPNMAFYWHNTSTAEGKKIFAPTLCLWQAILHCQHLGLKVFDFEGLWDERYPKLNKGWKGFTRFKLGFVKGE
jgi:hypothetical protein